MHKLCHKCHVNNVIWRGLLNFFLPIRAVQEQAGKDKDDAQPLPRDERVAEEDDRGQHGEEFAGGCDDGTGQWAEFTAVSIVSFVS